MVASAYAAHLARRASDYGVLLDNAPRIDMPAVKARAHTVVANSRDGVERGLRTLARCTVFHEHARFESPTTVRVGDDVLTAPRIFINVGGRARIPDFPGIASVPFLTNTTILELDAVPRHLVVVGGSYIGLEFAQMYRRFGADVTIVEMSKRLISREDEDISDAIRDIVEREGITVRTGAECISLSPHADGVAVSVDCTHGSPEVVGSAVLLAVGRVPNTHDLGLDKAGVHMDARGYITVDDTLATNVPGIWALGDCNGRGAFTHTAYNDYEIVAANLLDKGDRKLSDRIPGVRALHRSAARPRGHDRSRGPRQRQAAARLDPADDTSQPRDREGRNARVHEGRRGCGDETDPGCRDSRNGRRRGDSRHPRRHERPRALPRARTRRAHSSDGIGAHPDAAGRSEAGVNWEVGELGSG